MRCPKCHHQQKNTVECQACGVIFGKYQQALERKKAEARKRTAPAKGKGNKLKLTLVVVFFCAAAATAYYFIGIPKQVPLPLQAPPQPKTAQLPTLTTEQTTVRMARLHYTEFLPERYVPAWKVLTGDVDPELLAGHIIFVGTSAKGLQDIRFTPLGSIPGVEVNAQLVEQMLEESYLLTPDWKDAVVVIYLMVAWVLSFALVYRIPLLWYSVLGLAVIGSAFGSSWYSVTQTRLFLDPLLPSFAVAGMFLSSGFVRFFKTEGEKRWVRDAFSKYVSPNLVEHLVDNPKQLAIGGEHRECSFVMTDLAGFTPFMEKAEPQEVSDLLNTYLEEMVKIAFSYDATLDRFVGDAIALFFSAPVHQEDHAQRAITCALEMDAFAEEFSAARRKEGIPLGVTRIGVHSGVVLVGNFGGKAMFDYRCLGDPINTSARLETLNKHIGTRVAVSKVTKDMCPDFVGRPVGTFILKGKSEGLEVFEPLNKEEAESPRVEAYMAAYELLSQESDQAKAAFEDFAKEYPDDPLAKFHLDRIAQGEISAIVQMTKK